MGKIKQGKRTTAHRHSTDPMGSKVPLADEIESLRLAKSRISNQSTVNKSRNDEQDEEFINEKMTAKILAEARKQQNELQDEFGLDDHNARQVNQNDDDDDDPEGVYVNKDSLRPFKKFQTNFKQQQKIRRSDSDSDSDMEDQLKNRQEAYNEDEIVCIIFFLFNFHFLCIC